MMILLRTSTVSFEDLDQALGKLSGAGLRVFASAYPFENVVHPVEAVGPSPLSPTTIWERLGKAIREKTRLPSEIPLLLLTRHPLAPRGGLLYYSESSRVFVLACPIEGECNLDGFVDSIKSIASPLDREQKPSNQRM